VIKFFDVYESGCPTARTLQLLYDLLEERRPSESISHKQLPSLKEHVAFVDSHPYREWWLICVPDLPVATTVPVGAIYLSKQNEIGVGILTRHRRRGYGQAAIRAMVERHPGERLVANINPENHRSIAVFKKLGFRLLQLTFEASR
jgi:RimJ/RimL family protein N-acetyltransferase